MEDTLKINAFNVQTVTFGEGYFYNAGHLTIPKEINEKLPSYYDSVKIRIIQPYKHDVPVNSIMDVVPISTKVLGKIGRASCRERV